MFGLLLIPRLPGVELTKNYWFMICSGFALWPMSYAYFCIRYRVVPRPPIDPESTRGKGAVLFGIFMLFMSLSWILASMWQIYGYTPFDNPLAEMAFHLLRVAWQSFLRILPK
jgi:hypothetical protein